LLISLGEKILHHLQNGKRIATFPISSGRNPPSCLENSFGTPLGLHQIENRIGDGSPPGTVFISRVSTDKHHLELPDAGPDQKMYVLTRILTLRGLEAGFNSGDGCDSLARYIYIHGTPHPDRFPENMSGGCVILRDNDLIELHDSIPEKALVWIQEAPFESD